MRISAALPVGVSALLFAGARQRRELEQRLASHLTAAGYDEVILPILDYLEPYEPLLAGNSRSELYRFADRDGELLALRSDSTPMLARLLAPRLGGLTLPLRLFYRGDVVRYEEATPGRQREYYEIGGELLGAGATHELELLALFVELLLAAAVAPPIGLVLGFAGALDEVLLRCAPADAGALAAAVARREREPVRRVAPELLPVLERGMPERPEDLGGTAAARLQSLIGETAALAARFPTVRFTIDLAEFARQTRDPRLRGHGEGRPYYDGLVFQAFAGERAVPVGGGGRYDELFRQLGADVPAVGFALGVDRLLEARPASEGAR
jgi:ATP phosphoribosyltransferase regulatory subunit